MRPRNKGTFLLVACLAGLWACGPSDPHDARFRGTWKHIAENGVANTKTEDTVTAVVDHKRYRLETRTLAGTAIEVYDGEMLFNKFVPAPPADSTQNLESALGPSADSGPTESSRKAADYETGPRRFWTRGLEGNGKAGGLVAGRPSILYAAGERRLDGELSEQTWVDAKTGVLLKSVTTIYSSQIRSIVTQETWECQSIDYGPLDETAFAKP